MIKSKVNFWTMSYKGKFYSWTIGKEYDIRCNKDGVHVESDDSTGDIPWECCDQDLFRDVFGLDLKFEKEKVFKSIE